MFAFLLPALATPALGSAISNAKVERVAPDRVAVTWTGVAAVDIFLADTPEASPATATLVSRDDRDGRYEMAISPAARPYFLLSDRSGVVVRAAERVINLQQGSNFRDIGGYKTADGRHVRWGAIYRSGGQAMLTPADVQDIKGLGLANLIDLRSDEERVLAPTRLDGIPYSAVGYSMNALWVNVINGFEGGKMVADGGRFYGGLSHLLRPQIRPLFHRLVTREGPIAYNCSAGQDRTGVATSLVLSALDVPRETIYADYVLSSSYRRPKWELPPISETTAKENQTVAMFAAIQKDPAMSKPIQLVTTNGTPYLAFTFREIEQKWGSVEAYLEQETGIGKAEIADLRRIDLE